MIAGLLIAFSVLGTAKQCLGDRYLPGVDLPEFRSEVLFRQTPLKKIKYKIDGERDSSSMTDRAGEGEVSKINNLGSSFFGGINALSQQNRDCKPA